MCVGLGVAVHAQDVPPQTALSIVRKWGNNAVHHDRYFGGAWFDPGHQ